MSGFSLSMYISLLLRHKPELLHLHMNVHGWVSTGELIEKINSGGKYTLTMDGLRELVRRDSKGRYRLSDDETQIKACQGHSIPWVIPELEWREPPEFLYHGTTAEACEKIFASGGISRMSRHAVHMQADVNKAWPSARRWKRPAVVLKIDAAQMCEDGIAFGVSENGVWCCDAVPKEYIREVIKDPLSNEKTKE